MSSTSRRVLMLYRRILQTARVWESASGLKDDTKTERGYIKTEAKLLFHNNKNLNNPQEVELAIKEGEARLELALHYRNPYPRPVNVPPLATPKIAGKKLGKGQVRRRKEAKPVYIQSHDEYDKTV